jgi:amidase
LLQEALETLKVKGATVMEIELETKLKEIGDAEYLVLCYEFKDGVNQYLAKASCHVKSLQDVINYNLEHEAKAMPWFKQEILDTCVQKGDLQTKEYLDALDKVVRSAREAIDKLLLENKLDAIIGPANGPSWCIDLVNGDAFTGYGAYSGAAMAGYPSITVPMGMVHQLPIGLTFTGKAYNEPGLLALVYAYEQASRKRVAPNFIR